MGQDTVVASGLATIYPSFAANLDTGFVRLSGDGLGNSFYTYFHAVVMAHQNGARLIYPTWRALRIGPFLRGERSTRTYWNTFKPCSDELRGVRKMIALLNLGRDRAVVEVGKFGREAVRPGALNLVKSRDFTFDGLHAFRPMIRERLLSIINDRISPTHTWGGSGFVAVHVRLGDFATPVDTSSLLSGKSNVRIPLDWYVNVVSELRTANPSREVFIFSDGKDEELAPLLNLGAKVFRSGSDIQDLLALSSASLLVGSNSTYSKWAAFLGDMPSIWVRKSVPEEKPSAAETPLLHVSVDGVDVGAVRNFCSLP